MKKILFLIGLSTLLFSGCSPQTTTTHSNSTSSSDISITIPNVEIHFVTFHIFENETKKVEVNHGELVERFVPEYREGYNFINWYTSADGDTLFDFSQPITTNCDVYAHWLKEGESITSEVLKKALDQDYSNSTAWQYQSGMNDEFIVSNIDGYSVCETSIDGIGQRDFLFYHDYNGESHQYWYEEELGGAWIRQGIKFKDGSYAIYDVDNIYFTPMHSFSILSNHAEDFEYLGGGAFSLIDEVKIQTLLGEGLFKNVWDNDIAQIIIYLDDAKDFVEELRTYDSLDLNNDAYTRTQIFNIGTTSLIDVELPEKPTSENVKTYYEWKGQEEPVYTDLEAISLDYANPNVTSVNLDKTIELKYTMTPEEPDNKDLEFLYDGAKDGINISYSFTPHHLVVKGLIPGSYTIKIHDKLSDIYSNEVTVVVNDTPTSQFSNLLYDLKIKRVDGIPSLVNNLDNGYIAAYDGADLGFKVDNVNNGDNPKLNALTLAMMMDVNVSETMNVDGDNVFVNFELDHAINAMSFTYGALFENQISNIQSKFYKALIYTSSDGITWNLAQDWTEEFAADANAKGLSRKDIKFENQIQYVRIAFDSNFIGKYFTVALNSFAFYLES